MTTFLKKIGLYGLSIVFICVCQQSLVLSIAFNLLDAEAKQLVANKEAHMNENCPALSLPGSSQELQVPMLYYY